MAAKKRAAVDPKAAAGFYNPPAGAGKSKGKKAAIGVYLTSEEIEQLDQIVDDTGIKRSELLRAAVALFLREYAAGKIQAETETISRKILKF